MIYCVHFILIWGRRGHDRMVVGITTACAISAYHHQRCEFESRSGEVFWIQHYMIKFVSDLLQVLVASLGPTASLACRRR
jgi:hypothetical protein